VDERNRVQAADMLESRSSRDDNFLSFLLAMLKSGENLSHRLHQKG